MRERDEPRSFAADFLVGAAAGVLASAAMGFGDALHERLEPRWRSRGGRLQRGAHELADAGRRLGARVLRREPRAPERRRARIVFAAGYGLFWGLVHAIVRRGMPRAAWTLGLPFVLPVFLAWDRIVEPIERIGPPLKRLPGVAARRIGGHAAWAATAELLHRATKRIGA